uniref:Transmembrane protein n=1 Tax=Marseillevirus LCMAC103 TaxID=2506604 RepID=A0A481YU29_9VIRU|nr:MAG: hypothetical protein LCMAC103_00370 [Marseillevirus LCMAC103]
MATRLWDLASKKTVLFLAVLVAILAAAVIAIFAIDRAKTDRSRDVARLRLDPDASVAVPNPNLESARNTLVILASAIGVVVFLVVVLPFAWEGLDAVFTNWRDKSAVERLKKRYSREKSSRERTREEKNILAKTHESMKHLLENVQMSPYAYRGD